MYVRVLEGGGLGVIKSGKLRGPSSMVVWESSVREVQGFIAWELSNSLPKGKRLHPPCANENYKRKGQVKKSLGNPCLQHRNSMVLPAVLEGLLPLQFWDRQRCVHRVGKDIVRTLKILKIWLVFASLLLGRFFFFFKSLHAFNSSLP